MATKERNSAGKNLAIQKSIPVRDVEIEENEEEKVCELIKTERSDRFSKGWR